MRKFLAILMLVCSPALAGDLTYTWDMPTKNTDGTDIQVGTPSELVRTYIDYGICEAGDVPANPSTITVEASEPSETTILGLPAGEYCGRAYVQNVAGSFSDLSNLAVKTVAADTVPNPPVFVGTNLSVYTLVKQTDRFFLLPVGTVAEGTPCVADQTVNGKFVVPRELVVWSGNIQPLVVVADCVPST